MIRKLVVIAGAAGLALFFVALISLGAALRPEVETQVAQPVAPIAFVKDVAYGPIALTVSTQGEVQPRRQIQLSAQIAGKIESVSPNFANGGVIKSGETLVTIEDADYRLAVTRAEAQVAQAEQRLAVEEAEAALAAKDYAELSGDDSDEASLLALRKPQLAAAQADLASAKANLEDAKLALKRTKIRAPFDGRVRQINANVGQYVSPGLNLGEVFATDVAEVRLPLTDSDLAKLNLPFAFEAKGDDAPKVRFSADVAGRVRNWHGHIRRIDAAIDSSTRQISAIAEVIDPYGEGSDDGFPLAFGLFVDAEIVGPTIENGTIIPLLSMRRDDTVYVVDEEDKLAVKRPVIAAEAGSGLVAVSGIEEGDRLVISPVTVGIGDPVRPLYEDGSSASRLPEERPAADAGASSQAASIATDDGANL